MLRFPAPHRWTRHALSIALWLVCCALAFLMLGGSDEKICFLPRGHEVLLALLPVSIPERRASSTPLVLIVAYVLGAIALVVVLIFVRDWMLLAATLTAALAVLGVALWRLQKLSAIQHVSGTAGHDRGGIVDILQRVAVQAEQAGDDERRRRFRNGLRLVSDLFGFNRAALFVSATVTAKLQAAASYPEGFVPTPSEAALTCVRENRVVRGGRAGAHELAIPLAAGSKVLGVVWTSSTTQPDALAERVLHEVGAVFTGLLPPGRTETGENSLHRSASSLPDVLDDAVERIESASQSASRQKRFYRCLAESMHEGVIVAATDGTVIFANPRSQQILGLKEEMVLGRSFLDLLESHRGWTKDEVRASLRDALASTRSFEREVMIRAEPPTYYQLRVAVIRGADSPGENLGFFAVLSDVTKLRESDQVKSDVMSLVSHELRTPLTAIRGYSELLAEMQDLSPTARQCVQTINEASQRMSRMLTTFLDVAQLESGKQKLEKRPLRLNEIVRDAIYLILPLAEEGQIDIIDDTPQSVPVVPADHDLMVQVMTNLLNNAIKYSPPGTSVRISMDIAPRQIKVMVADQGLGIPAEALPRIWDKFYRVERELEGSTVGSGLGLNFVREIIRQHGGEVDVVSEIGVGSIFTFTLPHL